jgi:hypothetical protein
MDVTFVSRRTKASVKNGIDWVQKNAPGAGRPDQVLRILTTRPSETVSVLHLSRVNTMRARRRLSERVARWRLSPSASRRWTYSLPGPSWIVWVMAMRWMVALR